MPSDATTADASYTAYVARQRAKAEEQAWKDAGAARTSPHRGADRDVIDHIGRSVDANTDELFALAVDLYHHPEVGFEEVRTVAAIADVLAAHDVTANVGTYDVDTSFEASAGTGAGPRVAVLAEYDALPAVGHGCGHNLIAASAVGAFLAIRAVIDRTGGSVRLIGTPAEENGGGKELILRAGGFDDVDMAIMVHPGGHDVAAEAGFIGRRDVEVVYTGRTAHAAGQPFLGRNALDAAVLAYQGIAALRQHILPADRVHGIVTDGGQAVNVVPERAALRLFVRSPQMDTLGILSGRVDDVLHAAALSTGTTCEITWDVTPPYLPMRHNRLLADRYVAALDGVRRVLPYLDAGAGGGSTDMGNVSQFVPAIHPSIAFGAESTPGHSAERADRTVTAEARQAIRDGAFALAAVAADFLSDQSLRDDVDREFRDNGGRVTARERRT